MKFFKLLPLILILTQSHFSNAVRAGTFNQEKRTFYSLQDGLPSETVHVVKSLHGHTFAGTEKGLAFFDGSKFISHELVPRLPVYDLAANNDMVGALVKDGKGSKLFFLGHGEVSHVISIPAKYEISPQPGNLVFEEKGYIVASGDLLEFPLDKKSFQPKSLKMPKANANQICVTKENIWIAADEALLKYSKATKTWEKVLPKDDDKSWAPRSVMGVSQSSSGDVWFASPQGVGKLDESWNLFTGYDGLPFNDFTCLAASPNGSFWFGTTKGVIRYESKDFRYRQGLRWLPDDHVNDMTIDEKGNAWIATNKGIGVIEFVPMTLAEKANFYEEEIDKYNRRTPYGYVLEVSTGAPGEKSNVRKHDSDNDGLWTSMYGAGECYAYAATKDPKAKKRAKDVFEAMKFLGDVTQGGEFSPDPGYVARSILPTSGHNPNDGRIQRDIHNKANRDTLWKVFDPRWPVSTDGKWYWKGDTSSDELDGHFYFYSLYYDLVADTESEKDRVRQHVKKLTDHLVSHDFQLFDHDGKPTRWARFSPKELNADLNWVYDRGINSLSILSYLVTTAHITGDDSYREIARELVDKHGYMQNAHNPKTQRGAGTGNQSDDEMIVMCFYNLLKYTTDPEIKSRMALSFWSYWRILEPEMNPFFNYAIGATNKGIICEDASDKHRTDPEGDWLNESAETLLRFPLDRFDWAHKNSHRIDIIHSEKWVRGFDENSISGKGKRVNGKVIPVDETHFNHWNHDRWRLDSGGSGQSLADGAVFLLPYYMGLHYGFIK
jgi:hypothetical protein